MFVHRIKWLISLSVRLDDHGWCKCVMYQNADSLTSTRDAESGNQPAKNCFCATFLRNNSEIVGKFRKCCPFFVIFEYYHFFPGIQKFAQWNIPVNPELLSTVFNNQKIFEYNWLSSVLMRRVTKDFSRIEWKFSLPVFVHLLIRSFIRSSHLGISSYLIVAWERQWSGKCACAFIHFTEVLSG